MLGTVPLEIFDIADVRSWASGHNFGLALHLHPCFVYANNEGSSEYVHLRRFAFNLAILLENAISIFESALLMKFYPVYKHAIL